MASTITYLQGSLIAAEAFTIRVTDDFGNPGATDSDFAIAVGDEWSSVDSFVDDWATQIDADLGAGFDIFVNTTGASAGKLTFTTGSGDDWKIAWSHAGSAAESEKFRDFLGATGDIFVEGDDYTFPNAHAAGFYPALAASAIARSDTSHNRGQGTRLGASTLADLGSWTQHNTTTTDQGQVNLDLTLQLDCRTDWSELYAVKTFIDDIFADFGEPFTINHGGEVYTVFIASSPIEMMAQRVVEGWNDLLTVSLPLEASEVSDA